MKMPDYRDHPGLNKNKSFLQNIIYLCGNQISHTISKSMQLSSQILNCLILSYQWFPTTFRGPQMLSPQFFLYASRSRLFLFYFYFQHFTGGNLCLAEVQVGRTGAPGRSYLGLSTYWSKTTVRNYSSAM